MIAGQTVKLGRCYPLRTFGKGNLVMASQKNHTLLFAVLFGTLLGPAVFAQTPPATAPQSKPAAQSPQAAQKTVTQTVTFSASHQDYWGGAFAGTHRLELFGGYPNGTITFTPPFSTDFSFSNSDAPITFKGGMSNSEIGLTLNAYATAGDVSVSYPGNLSLTLDPQIVPNTAFNFATSFARDETNSNLDITPPGFDATLGGILKADFSLAGTVHTPKGLPNLDFTVLNNASVNTAFTIFDVQKDLVAPLEAAGGLNTSHDVHDLIDQFPAGVLSFEVDDPRVVNFNNASVSGSPALSYNGYQQLLNLNGDISNLLGFLGYAYFTDGKSLPQGLFNAEYNFDIGNSDFGAGIDLSYRLADLYGNMPLGFEQNFTFQASPKTTITLLGPNGKQIGQPMTVAAGAGGQISISDFYTDGTPVLAYGVTSVPITVQSSLDFSQNTLHNDTSLQWKPGLFFQPYSFYGDAHLSGFGQTLDYSAGLFSGPPFILASKTLTYTALSHDTTITPSNYSVSPALVTSTLNYVGTSIDQPHPALSDMSQHSAIAGTAGFPLTLTGTGFTTKSQAIVSIGGVTGTAQQTLNAKYLSPTSVQISLPSADLRTPAMLSMSVFNPGLPKPATYNSNALPFLVALPGCYLNASAAFQAVHLTQLSILNVTLANSSTIDATEVHLISATLNGVKANAPELTLGVIKSGTSAPPLHYAFPASAISSPGPARLVLLGTLSGKSFTLTVPVTVPTPSLTTAAKLSVQGLPGLVPSSLTLTLKNASLADTDSVMINSVALNGKSPSSGPHLPLTIGALAAGASASSSYVFPVNALPPLASSAQLAVTGTQQGKPFTAAVTVPISGSI